MKINRLIILLIFLNLVVLRSSQLFADQKLLDRTKLFEDIMGTSETLFKKEVGVVSTKPALMNVSHWYNQQEKQLSKKLSLNAKKQLERLKSVKIGQWSQPSLYELRQRAYKKLITKRTFAGNLALIVYNPAKAFESDIRYLHTVYPGAFFMIASNFNALEGGMGNYHVGFDHMNRGPVQGEEAVMTTMGAGIFRRYFLPRINLLKNLNDLLKIDTALYGTPIIMGLQNSQFKINFKDLTGLTVGVHRDIAVTSQDNPDHKMIHKWGNYYIPAYNLQTPIFGPGSLRVSHILTAGHDLRNVDTQSQQQQDIAHALIVASYEATILAAIDAQAKALVLTMLGAGAFENNPMWIIEALNRLVPVIVASDMPIYIVVRHSNPEIQHHIQKELEKIQTNIRQKAHDYKNSVTIFFNDLKPIFEQYYLDFYKNFKIFMAYRYQQFKDYLAKKLLA